MARRPRASSKTGVYHYMCRGVNKKKIFHKDADREFFKNLVSEYSKRFKVAIFHYCFMANHIHVLLKVDDIRTLSRFGHFTQRRYAYYYCKTHQWSEQVFRSRFLSIPVQDDVYLLECARYIERNPLDTGLVRDLTAYPYSSFRHYAIGRKDSLVTDNPLYETMGRSGKERRRVFGFYVSQNRPQEKQSLELF